MRIGIFTDTYLPDINGVVSSIRILENEMRQHGHEVYIVTTHGKLTTEMTDHCLFLPGIELKKLYGYVLTSPLHLKATEIVKGIELDLIHVHTEFGIGILARLIARRLNIPLVSTYHTAYEDYTHYVNIFNSNIFEKVARKTVASLSRLYGESCIEIIAPSLKTKTMLTNYGIKRPISVIPTGIELKRFHPDETSPEDLEKLKTELNINGETTILFVGRIALEKSIQMLLEGLLELKEAVSQFKFLVVGDGPELENLKSFVNKHGLKEQVIFTGKKPSELIPQYYHVADVFASASVTETQGMTYIEALAAAIPIFAREDEAVTKLLEEDKNGFYFNDSKSFAEKLLHYQSLSVEKKALLKDAAINSVSHYDSELFYNRVLKVYERAVLMYQDYYEVISFRNKGDLVEVEFEHNHETYNVKISVDLFAEYGLRKGKQVNPLDFDNLKAEEEYVLASQQFLRRISYKDRTRKEMYDWLTQKTSLPINKINQMVAHFEEKGYLNDERLTKSYISNMINLLQGQHRITSDLVKRGIPIELVRKAFSEEENYQELSMAIKYAEKVMGSIKDKSLRKKKQLLASRLYRQGYDQAVIQEAIENLNFIADQKKELDVLKKQADKVKRRHEKKFTGSELRNKVFQSLIQAGFEYNDIYFIIDEMEW